MKTICDEVRDIRVLLNGWNGTTPKKILDNCINILEHDLDNIKEVKTLIKSNLRLRTKLGERDAYIKILKPDTKHIKKEMRAILLSYNNLESKGYKRFAEKVILRHINRNRIIQLVILEKTNKQNHIYHRYILESIINDNERIQSKKYYNNSQSASEALHNEKYFDLFGVTSIDWT